MKYIKIKDKKQLQGLKKIMSMKSNKGRIEIYHDNDGRRYSYETKEKFFER